VADQNFFEKYWPWILGGGLIAGGALWLLRRPTIFTIVFENKNASSVIGNPAAPTFTALASQYGNATNYTSPYHPSLPNYITMTSGNPHGITDDVGFVIQGTDNLAAQMDAAGIPWRAYGESMPSPCYVGDTTLYAQRHMPFPYYASARGTSCATNVVPMDSLAADLASNSYRYVWLTPNLCNDAHDCPIGTADAWLASMIPMIQSSPGYQAGGVIFVLFDENEGGASSMPAIVISQALNQVSDSTPYDHRSYLAGVQDLLGLQRLPATVGVMPLTNILLMPGGGT
jgi:phosphatidylinositol-3-phosphatase